MAQELEIEESACVADLKSVFIFKRPKQTAVFGLLLRGAGLLEVPMANISFSEYPSVMARHRAQPHDDYEPAEPQLEFDAIDQGQIERLDSQVQRAQEQLLQLRRQQELIERQKRELEELSRKQDELDRGRSEMGDCLTRAIVTLEREATEAEKLAEQLRTARETFRRHLSALEEISPATWDTEILPRELNKALAVLEAARGDYEKMSHRINSATDGETLETAVDVGEYENGEFLLWLKRGFAFTLPLIVLGATALAVYAVRYFSATP